jgi:hypothetical protein
MGPKLHDHLVDYVGVTQDGDTHRNPAERHVFHTIEHIGKPGHASDWKQQVAAIVIAVVICTALYGVLYFAMHFQD